MIYSFELIDTSKQSTLKLDHKWIIKSIFICTLIFLSNNIFTYLYGDIPIIIKSTFDLNLFICIIFLLANFLKNKFNKLLIHIWIIFFYLGILNILSFINEDNSWGINIHDGSIYYFANILILICTLIYFENVKGQSKYRESIDNFKDSMRKVTNTGFTYLVLLFPIIFITSLYLHVGFIPILSGENFVDDMYEYNYGSLYGFKLLCVYSLLIVVVKIRESSIKIWSLVYIILVLAIMSVDGKRMVLQIGLISFIPFIDSISSQQIKPRNTYRQSLYIYGTLLVVFFLYMLINAIREGNIDQNPVAYYLEKIPIGVEFREFILSFTHYKPAQMPGYNYEISSFASLLNSSLLKVFGFSKIELVQMGSAYSWMRLDRGEFGIRSGILCELYIAYGYWGLLGMVVVGYLTFKVTDAIAHPKSYFSLFQNCILYSLIILLIVGQSDVFFGNLTVMFYFWILFKLLSIKIIK